MRRYPSRGRVVKRYKHKSVGWFRLSWSGVFSDPTISVRLPFGRRWTFKVMGNR